MQVIEIFNYRDTRWNQNFNTERDFFVCALAKIIHSVWNKIKDFKIVVCLSI